MAKVKSKPNLVKDLANITVPFDLYIGISMAVKEFKDKSFVYTHYTNQKEKYSLSFLSKELKESIILNIEKETLLIRQFSLLKEGRKLKVLYIIKPSERTFKLV